LSGPAKETAVPVTHTLFPASRFRLLLDWDLSLHAVGNLAKQVIVTLCRLKLIGIALHRADNQRKFVVGNGYGLSLAQYFQSSRKFVENISGPRGAL
jgi:hypothetical protein